MHDNKIFLNHMEYTQVGNHPYLDFQKEPPGGHYKTQISLME